jgi:hypothetical protein
VAPLLSTIRGTYVYSIHRKQQIWNTYGTRINEKFNSLFQQIINIELTDVENDQGGNSIEPPGFMKDWQFLDQLSHSRRLKNYSSLYSFFVCLVSEIVNY